MHFVEKTDVHRLLPYGDLIDWFQASLRAETPDSAVMVTDEPGPGENQFIALVGWQRDRLIAVKLVGVFPRNTRLSPPQASVQGLVCAFSGGTGTPLLVADGEAMTFRKTAADSALGARFLARPDAKSLLIVGAGGLAPHMALAHCAARPSIEAVRIWNRTGERAVAVASRLSGLGLPAEAVTDLDRAVAEHDIISCVTMSEQPLVKGRLLKPGAHLDLVGSYLPSMRECDEEAIARARVFVNSRNGIESAGDLVHAVASGRFSWDQIQADAKDLCDGSSSGRSSADEITVYKNIGGGKFDLFTVACLLQKLEA